jgi:hypothetical protein
VYQLAPTWRGQVLPPGVLGYPRSHPNVYSYARPVYIPGRGFVTLGLGRRGLGQSLSSVTSTFGCDAVSLPACSAWDATQALLGFAPSAPCTAAIENCLQTQNATPLVLAPGGALPPGAGPISTANLVAQTATPTGSNVAPEAAAALTAYQAAVTAANQCPAGTVAQGDGTCAPPSSPGIPTWVWAALIAAGLLVVAKI